MKCTHLWNRSDISRASLLCEFGYPDSIVRESGKRSTRASGRRIQRERGEGTALKARRPRVSRVLASSDALLERVKLHLGPPRIPSARSPVHFLSFDCYASLRFALRLDNLTSRLSARFATTCPPQRYQIWDVCHIATL